jgi:hypothetical protein
MGSEVSRGASRPLPESIGERTTTLVAQAGADGVDVHGGLCQPSSSQHALGGLEGVREPQAVGAQAALECAAAQAERLRNAVEVSCQQLGLLDQTINDLLAKRLWRRLLWMLAFQDAQCLFMQRDLGARQGLIQKMPRKKQGIFGLTKAWLHQKVAWVLLVVDRLGVHEVDSQRLVGFAAKQGEANVHEGRHHAFGDIAQWRAIAVDKREFKGDPGFTVVLVKLNLEPGIDLRHDPLDQVQRLSNGRAAGQECFCCRRVIKHNGLPKCQGVVGFLALLGSSGAVLQCLEQLNRGDGRALDVVQVKLDAHGFKDVQRVDVALTARLDPTGQVGQRKRGVVDVKGHVYCLKLNLRDGALLAGAKIMTNLQMKVCRLRTIGQFFHDAQKFMSRCVILITIHAAVSVSPLKMNMPENHDAG